MSVPTDAKLLSPAALSAAAIPGTLPSAPVPVADHTSASFSFYFNGTDWRCTVVLAGGTQPGGLRQDFRVLDILAAGDTPVQMFQRLFVAAKYGLGIS